MLTGTAHILIQNSKTIDLNSSNLVKHHFKHNFQKLTLRNKLMLNKCKIIVVQLTLKSIDYLYTIIINNISLTNFDMSCINLHFISNCYYAKCLEHEQEHTFYIKIIKDLQPLFYM